MGAVGRMERLSQLQRLQASVVFQAERDTQ